MKAFIAEQRRKAREARNCAPACVIPNENAGTSVPRSLAPLQINQWMQLVSQGRSRGGPQAEICRIVQLPNENDPRVGIAVVEHREFTTEEASELIGAVTLGECGLEKSGYLSKSTAHSEALSRVARSELLPLCTLEDALRNRYSDGKIEDGAPITRAMAVQLAANGVRALTPFEPRLCPSLTELDISVNCISSFSEVAWLISCVPKLRLLNVSGNPLRADAALASESRAAADSAREGSQLETLVLNHLPTFSWEALCQLLDMTGRV